MKEFHQIYDRIFKRIFTLSDMAITNMINGLFGTSYPPDSHIEYSNREGTKPDLSHSFADLFLVINDKYHYHLEAQMYHDNAVVMRVFEYGFYHAMETRADDLTLRFPEPIIIYFGNISGIPAKSNIRIILPDQKEFIYSVKNFVYLQHDIRELNQRKMIVFIPFQMLRIRDILMPGGTVRPLSDNDMKELKKIIESDILDSIKANLMVGNITQDDYNQLIELTNQLYEQIIRHYQEKGGDSEMKPLLPGAMELPNDKYRIRIDELEAEVARQANRIASLTDKSTSLTDENASLADENASLARENKELRRKIQEMQMLLESK